MIRFGWWPNRVARWRVSVNVVGGAGLRARQYGPLAAAEGRPTSLPTFLTPTSVALRYASFLAGPRSGL